jgi:hypothetical protein
MQKIEPINEKEAGWIKAQLNNASKFVEGFSPSDSGQPLTLACSDASCHSSGCKDVSPAGGTFPVATVVISGDGAGDQSVGSPEVKVLDGWVKRPGQLRQEGKQVDRS